MEKKTKFKEWIVRAAFSKDTETLHIEELTRPLRIGKIRTPENLDDMTIGQMVQIAECKGGGEMFYTVCRVLLKMKQKQVDNARAVDVVRFCGWVAGQVQKINKLFDSVKSKPTKEEERAGIENLKFGVFGLIDWYALRMGITDHEEVTKVTWGRVYKCLEMDNKKRGFEKRLAEVYRNEH
ncbi:MAG: hypothetical protein HXN76_01810 [Prevotella pallens]|uniref:hypothetical protein n=1 Tax=Prevotella pallens TaxID=60133 RepID=UPI001CB1841F|nr:hypothetical protein [Prevotella pallens]MBF1491445.1 hypothetical protein [Prevotella pallens]